ncbi:hypothetical protein EYC84_002134 [Monilinia fructicola]|uniref:Fucose-specific lectin n=1 Tax=Monilinia fructicola TaxID=38448 RepID=A0A5M9JUD4_MONFR|nr:hypothetical protein EYC84_002134 [Monilinia fructicola]
MQVLAFMIWLVVVEAIYNTSLFSFSATQTSSTVLFNSGDGQAIGLDASLASNSYRTSTPKKATERIATSIAPALCNYLWIHTYITDPDGIVWRRTYGAVEYGWTDDWITFIPPQKPSGEVCFSLTSSTRYAPSQCQRFNAPFLTQFSSTLSQITTQTTDTRLSLVVHYLGISSDGKLLLNRQWSKNDGSNYLTQNNLSGSLKFVGEPLVSNCLININECDLDVWGISNTGRLYRRSFTGDISSGTWSDWEDLGIYNTLKTGWYPSKTTWSPSLYTNWLSPPTISVYNDGTTRGSDVHVCGN